MGTATDNDEVKSTVRARSNTVGTEAVKRLKQADEKIEARELQREINKEYYDELNKCIHREPASGWTEPFYVVVMLTKPGYLINVIRRRFFARRTLPEPQPDQTVWYCDKKAGQLQLLWSLPDLESINAISHNRHNLHKDDQEVGKMVVDYLEKTLWRKHAPKEAM